MNLSEKILLSFLNNQSVTDVELKKLTALEVACLYVDSALLVTIMEFLKEQLWIKNKTDKKRGISSTYEEVITPFFEDELKPVFYLKDFLIQNGSSQNKIVSKKAEKIERKILDIVSEYSSEKQRSFLSESLKQMTVHFLHEEDDKNRNHHGLRLYRTFDQLDKIFDLNYKLDRKMSVDHKATERIFQGAGVGVQSGYSSILLALHFAEIESGGTIIDLGSGYGRVGLAFSLLRPDVHFTGYEYVPHRVDVSNQASEFLGLQENLKYQAQDLSVDDFKIPVADIYYLYDSFTNETYDYVLKQIVEISKKKKITVITKGNARKWLMIVAEDNSWPSPLLVDDGNLCLFKSA